MEIELEPRVKPLEYKVKAMSRESPSQKADHVLDTDIRSHWSTATNTKEWILLELNKPCLLSHIRIYNKSVLEWEISVGLRYKLIGVSVSGLEPEFEPVVNHLLPSIISHKQDAQDMHASSANWVSSQATTLASCCSREHEKDLKSSLKTVFNILDQMAMQNLEFVWGIEPDTPLLFLVTTCTPLIAPPFLNRPINANFVLTRRRRRPFGN